MVYKEGNKVIIRIAGEVLQFGDIAIIKGIDYARLIDTYLCECPLRGVAEWMAPQHFDKHQERPPVKAPVKAPVYDRIKNAAKDMDANKKPQRPPAVYTNLPSSYKYDNDDHASETP